MWRFSKSCDHDWEKIEQSHILNRPGLFLEDGDVFCIKESYVYKECQKCGDSENVEPVTSEKLLLSVEGAKPL